MIRIVLTNKNMGKDKTKLEDSNNYRLVADNIIADQTLEPFYEFHLIELGVTYSAALADLNPDESFKHTRTDIDETVKDTDSTGDLIIQGDKKELV